MDPEDQAIPCGLIAKSIFNDDFTLIQEIQGGLDKQREIVRQNIAWASDIEYIYKNVEDKGDWKDIQWIDMTNGKFKFYSLIWNRGFHYLDENSYTANLPQDLGKTSRWPGERTLLPGD